MTYLSPAKDPQANFYPAATSFTSDVTGYSDHNNEKGKTVTYSYELAPDLSNMYVYALNFLNRKDNSCNKEDGSCESKSGVSAVGATGSVPGAADGGNPGPAALYKQPRGLLSRLAAAAIGLQQLQQQEPNLIDRQDSGYGSDPQLSPEVQPSYYGSSQTEVQSQYSR